MKRLFWVTVGTIAVFCGVIGLFLPVIPTVPFLLLAAYAYANSSQTLYNWLLSNKTFGPMIRDWQEHGAISRRTKIIATLSLLGAVVLQLIVQIPFWVIGAEAAIFAIVLTFIWTRPES